MACYVQLFVLSAIVTLISPIAAQEPIYRCRLCPETTTYTAKSAFAENLNATLSSLYTNATSSNGFYNSSIGQSLDRAYGLFLCGGDISPQLCQSCVKAAGEKAIIECPNRKEAIIWYAECMLRYSDRSIFSHMEGSPDFILRSGNNVADPRQFNATLNGLMDRLINLAVSSSNLFATEQVNFTTSISLYGMVQCSRDIAPSDCGICLAGYVSETQCYGKDGCSIYKPSCNIRYETYPFYSVTSVPAPTSRGNTTPPTPPPPPSRPPPPPPATLTNSSGNRQIPSKTVIAVVIPTVLVIVILWTSCYFLLSRKARRKHDALKEGNVGNGISMAEDIQLDLRTIKAATNNFSDGSKIGEGGFGSVYKGTFDNGQEVAIKRLSRSSGQGVEDFRNEVALVAKLQHRNLVRLLGFCAEEGEKILVFEFLPKKSLDYFLFDPGKQRQLNWSRRCNIIKGIARALQYLHEESRLKIIHRDLKASNILLDENMNPKIADFGLARLCGVDQSQVNTNRIAGTYGYMSPEYAMHGQLSVKSDVFSFGVLVLEIICGKKNSCFHQSDCAEYLLSFAWRRWREGTTLELLDPTLRNSYSTNEVTRCIHIGLLCVQEDPVDRPMMATIVLMLNSPSVPLPPPKRPAFFLHNSTSGPSIPAMNQETKQSSSRCKPSSVNDASITELYPR